MIKYCADCRGVNSYVVGVYTVRGRAYAQAPQSRRAHLIQASSKSSQNCVDAKNLSISKAVNFTKQLVPVFKTIVSFKRAPACRSPDAPPGRRARIELIWYEKRKNAKLSNNSLKATGEKEQNNQMQIVRQQNGTFNSACNVTKTWRCFERGQRHLETRCRESAQSGNAAKVKRVADVRC
eukprot:6211364-Pleurochrysis_carterae.AAC.1